MGINKVKNRCYKAKRTERLMEIFLVVVTLGLILLLVLFCIDKIKFDDNSGVASFLPDSLGGFIGVLVGFGADFLFIDKIKDNKKYRTLVKLLNIDFDNFLFQIERIQTEKEERKDKEEKGKEDLPKFVILKDIIDEADNLSLFDKKENGDILFALMQIYYLNAEINNLDEKAFKENYDDLKAKLLTHIIEFRCLTQTGKLDSKAKSKYEFFSTVLNQEKKYRIDLQNEKFHFFVYDNGRTGVATEKPLLKYPKSIEEDKEKIKQTVEYCQNRLDGIFK